MNKKVSITIECKSCQATGLYSGMAERGRTAVPCYDCDGTGKRILEGTQFTHKKACDDIDKVFRHTGVVITEEFEGGVSYEEWLADPKSVRKIGNELRGYTCPFMTYQSHGHSEGKIGLWAKCHNECLAGQLISNCSHFPEKDKCWEQFDRETQAKYPEIDNIDDISE